MAPDEHELRVREVALNEAARWCDSVRAEHVVEVAEKFLAFLSPGRARIAVDDPPRDIELIARIRHAVRIRGGNVQVALGSDIPSEL